MDSIQSCRQRRATAQRAKEYDLVAVVTASAVPVCVHLQVVHHEGLLLLLLDRWRHTHQHTSCDLQQNRPRRSFNKMNQNLFFPAVCIFSSASLFNFILTSSLIPFLSSFSRQINIEISPLLPPLPLLRSLHQPRQETSTRPRAGSTSSTTSTCPTRTPSETRSPSATASMCELSSTCFTVCTG